MDLLRHVGSQLRHWPVLLLVTYRADELTPGRPFALQLPALVRETVARRLDLRRLDADALRTLVASRSPLALADEDRLVAYLVRHADGNPFFATELLRTLEEEGLLRRDAKGWTLAALDRVIVPTLLRQVIDGRVSRLGDETRKPLALAAVIGQEVPLDLWSKIAGLAEEDILDIVEQAIEAHLLEANRDGTRVHFSHALTRDALYEGILPPRRRIWHRQVAETLMASAQADPDTVAFHLQASGDPRAWEWLVTAADRAQRAYAWLTAAERLGAAIALLDGVAGKERTRGQLACRFAYLKRFSDPAGALDAVAEAGRLAARIGDADLTVEARWVRGVYLGYANRFRASFEEATNILDEIVATGRESFWTIAAIQHWLAAALPATSPLDSTEDERVLARLHAEGLHFRKALFLWFIASSGHSRSVVDFAERFDAVLAEVPRARGGIRAVSAFACFGLGTAQAALGRVDEARRAFNRSYDLLREFDHQAVLAMSLLNESCDVAETYGAADPETRRLLATEAEAALGRAAGAFYPGFSPRLAWLGCLILDGRWEEALQILRDVPEPGTSYFRRAFTVARAALARNRGEPEIAWAQIRAHFPQGPVTEPGDIIHQEGLVLQRLAADLCLDARDLPGTRAWLAAHDAWLVWSESVLGRADGHLAWARYHRAAEDTARARSSLSVALTLAESPEQPLVRLAALRLLGEIETAATDYDEAEAHLGTALDLADRCATPFERSLTLLSLAELPAARGSIADALRLLDEAGHICAQLGAAPTLARVDALVTRITGKPRTVTNPAGLTQREVEVLRLLVAGKSNPEIAEALFISRDTARTHVANIFRKLDVGTRAEAVDHVHRSGLLSSIPPPAT